ncbi:MAG: hypothetical protein ACFFBJ_04695 [Promethearchaeota archaeon]
MKEYIWIQSKQSFMETATIYEIEIDNLKELIQSFPNLWPKDKWMLDSGMLLLLGKSGESNESYFAMHLFSVPHGLLAVFMEYQKETMKATFDIHGYTIACNQIQGRAQYTEQRVRDFILGYEGEAFHKLSAEFNDEIFECPECCAKYSLGTLRMSSDGRIECQNCGRLVHFEIEDQELNDSN